jgi:hypothetical protein
MGYQTTIYLSDKDAEAIKKLKFKDPEINISRLFSKFLLEELEYFNLHKPEEIEQELEKISDEELKLIKRKNELLTTKGFIFSKKLIEDQQKEDTEKKVKEKKEQVKLSKFKNCLEFIKDDYDIPSEIAEQMSMKFIDDDNNLDLKDFIDVYIKNKYKMKGGF